MTRIMKGIEEKLSSNSVVVPSQFPARGDQSNMPQKVGSKFIGQEETKRMKQFEGFVVVPGKRISRVTNRLWVGL